MCGELWLGDQLFYRIARASVSHLYLITRSTREWNDHVLKMKQIVNVLVVGSAESCRCHFYVREINEIDRQTKSERD